jgi:hypothetical protein
MMIRTVTANRYIVPLREGGSLPAVVEADDQQMYVMKFVGAGQGPKALIAELIAGEIGRALGLNVPELVLMHMSPVLGRSEPNPEIRSLLQASGGLNLGMHYLPSSFAYNALARPGLNRSLASSIVWFDAYVTNVDRTDRNVNMLIWQDRLWLIDHGACLYFHHNWPDYLARSQTAFPMISQHTLLPLATRLEEVDPILRGRLNPTILRKIVDDVPDEWLAGESFFADAAAHRSAYVDYLVHRLAAAPIFVEEAIRARNLRV